VTDPREVQVLRVDRDYVPIPGCAELRAVVWPGMGARHRSMHYMRLEPGETSRTWRHPGEAVYYVVLGSGWFEDRTTGQCHDIRAGLIVHVDADTPYAVAAREALTCVGGPCPPDRALYAEVPMGGAGDWEGP
jgi:quercetin dioxygenase-like cupin family protein